MKSALLRLSSFLLAVILLLPLLASCGYRPVKSTEWEATPVFTLGEDTVNMEMLHAFFYAACEDTPGFSDTYFTNDATGERYRTAVESAIREIAGIYALFAVCRSLGLDPFSDEIDDVVAEYIEMSVEGGALGDQNVTGFESYDQYLAYIRKHYHMNDAVNRLMVRYAVCEELLQEYYLTNYSYTEQDVAAFFESDDCIRITWVNRMGDSAGLDLGDNLDLLTRARNSLITGDYSTAIQYSLSNMTDFYMGRYTFDPMTYGVMIDAAYSLEVGETSSILDLGSEGYCVLRKRQKDADALSSKFSQIARLYLGDVMYGTVAAKQDELIRTITYTDFYLALGAKDILNAQ